MTLKVGIKVWYRPTQPDAFQGHSYPTEVVGTVVETGTSKDGYEWVIVKPDFGAPKWREEQISLKDFKERGVEQLVSGHPLYKGVRYETIS